MSRLLFAAARGARIEALRQLDWIPLTHISLLPNSHAKRIHPNDEHLQYGPISTALREMAEDSSYRGDWEGYFAHVAANEFIDYYDWRWCKPDYPLYYLFLAEALADSGL
jgi:hypothetical protein